MKVSQLLECLDFFDKQGKWLFRLSDFLMYFRTESEQSIKISLSRHAKHNLITQVSKGIYANARARSKMLEKHFQAAVANYLRDKVYSYLSLESVLSEEGLISQLPNRYTFVSLKFSHTYHTPFITVEYTQTKRDVKSFFEGCYYDEVREIWVASAQKAVDDAYKFRRAVDLYDEQLEKDKKYGFI